MDLSELNDDLKLITEENDEIVLSCLNVWRTQELYNKTKEIETSTILQTANIFLRYSIYSYNSIEVEQMDTSDAKKYIEQLKYTITRERIDDFSKWFILINSIDDTEKIDENKKTELYGIKEKWLNEIKKRKEWAGSTFGSMNSYKIPSAITAYSSQFKALQKYAESSFEAAKRYIENEKSEFNRAQSVMSARIEENRRKYELENVILEIPKALSNLKEVQSLSYNANKDLINASNEILRQQVKQAERDGRFSKIIATIALLLSILSIVASVTIGYLQLISNDNTTKILVNIQDIISETTENKLD